MKIDKGIPYPSELDTRNQYGTPKYGFCQDMAVGDSVDISGMPNPRQFYVGMSVFGARNNMRFSKRGDRVWRVE